jgi:cytochrome c oxidase subunit 2
MSALNRRAAPLATGLVAGGIAFAAVVLIGGGDGQRPAGGPSSGRELFARMGCGSCHRLAAAGSEGRIGPDLDARLAGHTRASLTAKIVAPREGSTMPADFGRRMSDGELDALVDFLLAARAPG